MARGAGPREREEGQRGRLESGPGQGPEDSGGHQRSLKQAAGPKQLRVPHGLQGDSGWRGGTGRVRQREWWGWRGGATADVQDRQAGGLARREDGGDEKRGGEAWQGWVFWRWEVRGREEQA